MVFQFVSEGPKGKIPKLIKYSETNFKDMYNLGFGDMDAIGEIDDMAISDNGDSDMVLATVISTVYAFSDRYPDYWIYATGSTKSRTRLYRIGISKYMDEISMDFDIYGLRGDNWEPFKKNIDYEAFLVQRKKL
ncbi:MAG: hypothetical protein JSS76_19425 [Bacteroidetes bacterium]|nr:hypothetical protein [Bacteroidota bacterium]